VPKSNEDLIISAMCISQGISDDLKRVADRLDPKLFSKLLTQSRIQTAAIQLLEQRAKGHPDPKEG
jgi:hypothetical protein